MKARLGILLGIVSLSTGCIAIPPLITVQKHSDGDEERLRQRVEELEKRIRELESTRERP